MRNVHGVCHSKSVARCVLEAEVSGSTPLPDARASACLRSYGQAPLFFFCFIISAFDLYRSWQQITKPFSPPRWILLRSRHDVASSPPLLRLSMVDMK